MLEQMDGAVANTFGGLNLNPFGGASISGNVFGQTSTATLSTSSATPTSSSSSSSFSCAFEQKMGSFSGLELSSNNQSILFTNTGSALGISGSSAFSASSGGFAFGASSSTNPATSSSFSFGASNSSAFVFGSAATASSKSPFCFGAQVGQQGGNKYEEKKKWMVDDGQSNADCSCCDKGGSSYYYQKTTSSNPFGATSIFDQNMSNSNAFSFTSQSTSSISKLNTNPYSFSFTSQSIENQRASSFSFISKPKQNQSQNLNPLSSFPQSNPSSNANFFSFPSVSSFAKESNHNPFSSPSAVNISPIFSSSTASSSNVFGSGVTQATCTPVTHNNASATHATGLTHCTSTACPTTTATGFVSTPSFQTMMTSETSPVFSFGKNNDAQTSSQGGTGACCSCQKAASQTGIATLQYGISSLTVGDRSGPSRGSFSVPKHLSQRRVRLPLRRYHTKTDAPQVSLYAPKLDAFVIPRQNPRKLVTDPAIVNINNNVINDWLRDEVCEDELPNHLESHIPVQNPPTNQNDDLIPSGQQRSDATDSATSEDEDDLDDPDLNLDENDENAPPFSTVDCNNHCTQKGLQAAIVYEHGAEIEALMPKLRHADYYTEPRIPDLAAKERADPGYCSRVPDFVVGRTGYGRIKFSGETDVRKLDLEAIVHFGNKEVVVYREEKKKPNVGQGLNKLAEVTLLNIKCTNKKTGERYLGGAKAEKYKEMLAKKTEEQGGEFISYDPVKAEWRFKVKHFSRYGLFVPPR